MDGSLVRMVTHGPMGTITHQDDYPSGQLPFRMITHQDDYIPRTEDPITRGCGCLLCKYMFTNQAFTQIHLTILVITHQDDFVLLFCFVLFVWTQPVCTWAILFGVKLHMDRHAAIPSQEHDVANSIPLIFY